MSILAKHIEQLKAAMPKIDQKDKGFAQSLLDQYAKKGTLSERQAPWVEKLANSILVSQKPSAPAVVIGDYAPILALFAKAKEKLKYPSITLSIAGTEVVFRIAGSKSKYHGSVMISSKGSFENRQFYGMLKPSGEWSPSAWMEHNPLFREALVSVIIDMVIDPVKVVQQYGALTGRCSFCNLPLSAGRSTAVGFGETCAENYGLHHQWKSAKPLFKAAPKVEMTEAQKEMADTEGEMVEQEMFSYQADMFDEQHVEA